MTDYSEYRITTGLPDYDFSNEAYRAGWEDGHRMVAYPVRDSQYRGTEDFDAYRAGYNKGQMEFTGSRRTAHDTGARTTIQHCCFCGSGSVYARSDGAAQCDFCDSVFTVQLQPTHSGTPGTVDGQSYDPFEEGAIEDEDPAMEPGEEVLARRRRRSEADRRRRLREALEESPPRGARRRPDRLRY